MVHGPCTLLAYTHMLARMVQRGSRTKKAPDIAATHRKYPIHLSRQRPHNAIRVAGTRYDNTDKSICQAEPTRITIKRRYDIPAGVG